MYELKTKPNDQAIADVFDQLTSESKRQDAMALLKVFTETTGQPPTVWGAKQIGFGTYRYKNSKGQIYQYYVTGFAVTDKRITLYVVMPPEQQTAFLARLGKATHGKGCVYLNKLSDVDLAVIPEMIKSCQQFVMTTFAIDED